MNKFVGGLWIATAIMWFFSAYMYANGAEFDRENIIWDNILGGTFAVLLAINYFTEEDY